jgi:sulfane dehydrogenase subunit SoxC
MNIRKRRKAPPPEPIAGTGLLDRRALLGPSIVFGGATTTGVGTLLTGAAAEPLKNDPWSLEMARSCRHIKCRRD